MNKSAQTRQTSLNKRKKFLIIHDPKEIRSINLDRSDPLFSSAQDKQRASERPSELQEGPLLLTA